MNVAEKIVQTAGRQSLGEFAPEFHLPVDCCWCEIVTGELVLKEHEAARWLGKNGFIMLNGFRKIFHRLKKWKQNCR